MSRLQDVIIAAGLLAGRPAFGSEGRLYFATDNATLYRDTGIAWETYAGGGTHDLLSAIHPDTDPQAVTRGSIIYGDATPDWQELVIGAASRVLTVNVGGTEPEWAVAGTATWVLIAETVLGAPAASVTFAAIPGTYRSLFFQIQARSSVAAASDDVEYQINADGGANYNWQVSQIYNNVVVTTVTRGDTVNRAGIVQGVAGRANCFSMLNLLFDGYASAAVEKFAMTKSIYVFDLNADADLRTMLGLNHWASTAAITSVVFDQAAGPNFVAGSIFTLYGIT